MDDGTKTKEDDQATTISYRRLTSLFEESLVDPSAESVEFRYSTGESIRIQQNPKLAAGIERGLGATDPGCPTELGGCTGATLWDSSVVVAKYLEEMCSSDEDDEMFVRILELGSGTGLLGCVMHHLRPYASIICTDREEILPLLKTNLLQNCSGEEDGGGKSISAPLAMPYMWGKSIQPLLEAFDRKYPTLVLAVDCVYDEEAVPSLISALRFLLLDSQGKALVAVDDTIRRPQVFRFFCKRLAGAGLALDEIDVSHLEAKEQVRLFWVEAEEY